MQNLKNRYDIVGNAPELNRALEIAVSVAPTDLTALIIGESGVGKESLPKIIHQNSRRKSGKYFAVNCGAIPEGTIDSELFGHEKGSFTGAVEMRRGYFEEADGGTLFLDEIGELPMASQAKLLRVLQDGEFIRVGSSKVMKTDVRVVAATNVDLLYAVQKGRFRADLYYRLNAVTIKMPALRDRGEDIYLLFRKFIADFNEKYQTGRVSLLPDAVNLLKAYRWPGNIRQLKNVAETVAALEGCKGDRCEINSHVLAQYIPKDGFTLPSVTVKEDSISAAEKEAMIRMIYQLRQEVEYLKEAIKPQAGNTINATASSVTTAEASSQAIQIGPASIEVAPASVVTPADTITPASVVAAPGAKRPEEQDDAEWQETEIQKKDLSIHNAGNELIKLALERNGGNRKAAAAQLGISERTLYRKIKEWEASGK